MTTSIVLTHIAPMSLADCLAHFTQPLLLREWFCDHFENGDDDLFLAWGQNHFVLWRFKEIASDHLLINQLYMGDPERSSEILVEFKDLGDQTEVNITQTGVTPMMESHYRSDWYNLRYLGAPKPNLWRGSWF